MFKLKIGAITTSLSLIIFGAVPVPVCALSTAVSPYTRKCSGIILRDKDR
jgi:hypothetical protein